MQNDTKSVTYVKGYVKLDVSKKLIQGLNMLNNNLGSALSELKRTRMVYLVYSALESKLLPSKTAHLPPELPSLWI